MKTHNGKRKQSLPEEYEMEQFDRQKLDQFERQKHKVVRKVQTRKTLTESEWAFILTNDSVMVEAWQCAIKVGNQFFCSEVPLRRRAEARNWRLRYIAAFGKEPPSQGDVYSRGKRLPGHYGKNQ